MINLLLKSQGSFFFYKICSQKRAELRVKEKKDIERKIQQQERGRKRKKEKQLEKVKVLKTLTIHFIFSCFFFLLETSSKSTEEICFPND